MRIEISKTNNTKTIEWLNWCCAFNALNNESLNWASGKTILSFHCSKASLKFLFSFSYYNSLKNLSFLIIKIYRIKYILYTFTPQRVFKLNSCKNTSKNKESFDHRNQVYDEDQDENEDENEDEQRNQFYISDYLFKIFNWIIKQI